MLDQNAESRILPPATFAFSSVAASVALVVAIVLAATVFGPSPGSADNTEDSNPEPPPAILHCMSGCIKHEGNTPAAKTMCKLRCANVAVPTLPSGGDCMAIYKNCNRTCPKDDGPCRKTCKAGLMQCR